MPTLSGITGPMTAAEHARLMASGVGAFAADGAGQLVGVVAPSGTRSVLVSAGTARAGGGRLSVPSAEESPSAAQNTGSTPRVDALVYRTDIGGSGSCTLMWVAGAADGSPPAITYGATNPAKINRQVGQVYDALLGFATVRPGVGAFSTADWAPTTPYGGVAGDLMVPRRGFYTWVDCPVGGGLRIIETDTRYRRVGTGNATSDWPAVRTPDVRLFGGGITGFAGLAGGAPGPDAIPIIQSYLTSLTTNNGGYIDIKWPQPFPNGVMSAHFTPLVGGADANPVMFVINPTGHTLSQSSIRARNVTNGAPRINNTLTFVVTVIGW